MILIDIRWHVICHISGVNRVNARSCSLSSHTIETGVSVSSHVPKTFFRFLSTCNWSADVCSSARVMSTLHKIVAGRGDKSGRDMGCEISKEPFELSFCRLGTGTVTNFATQNLFMHDCREV
jgi:hypothetical protein